MRPIKDFNRDKSARPGGRNVFDLDLYHYPEFRTVFHISDT
jgi:hypothetical protein